MDTRKQKPKTDKEIWDTYEIERTVAELLAGGWERAALQFPDNLLCDAGAVVRILETTLGQKNGSGTRPCNEKSEDPGKFMFEDERKREPVSGFQKQKARFNEIRGVGGEADLHLKRNLHHDPAPTKHEQGESEIGSFEIGADLDSIVLNSAYLGSKNGELDIDLKIVDNKNIDILPRQESTELRDGGLELDSKAANYNTANEEKSDIVLTLPHPTSMELGIGGLEADTANLSVLIPTERLTANVKKTVKQIRFYVLADTSYGSCCVDEIAAEHVNAQVIVHFGRSCLSPTVRLPVIYIFTTPPLDLDAIVRCFQDTFKNKNSSVVLIADIMYDRHIQFILKKLEQHGYKNIIAPEVVHDPASVIPNRRIGLEVDLKSYSLFHISEPPSALLLTLSSRVHDMYIFPTLQTSTSTSPTQSIRAVTSSLIRRRYAIVNSLNTCSIFGILINTLSVAHHLHALEMIQSLIRSAGKKYYNFVVGKINAAKLANFSEIGGWVVIGCWESSLLESKDFYRPVITPWELEWVLTSEKVRVWNGEWRGDFEDVGKLAHDLKDRGGNNLATKSSYQDLAQEDKIDQLKSNTSPDVSSGSIEEPESEPPEFDLRTGRYISNSRPMQTTSRAQNSTDVTKSKNTQASQALCQRPKGTLVRIGNEISPGAHFLKNQRTWIGLGSDFHQSEDISTRMEIGRAGVARGYLVGEEQEGGERRT